MFINYIKTAFRNMFRQKIYSVINVTGLAMGLALCMILFIWIHYHLSFDRFHEKSDRTVRLVLDVHVNGINDHINGGTNGRMAPELKAEFPEIEKFVRMYRVEETVMVRNGDKVKPYWGFYCADPDFFEIFSYKFKYGDPNTALVEPKSLVLTAEAADALFGDENPIGRFVRAGDDTNYKITGVLEKAPRNSHLNFQVLCSFDPYWLESYMENHDYDLDFMSYLLITPGADIQQLEAKMPPLVSKIMPAEVKDGLSFVLQPLEKIHLYSSSIDADRNWRKLDITYIYLFSAIALLVLAIACMNYINLATARAQRRAREVGIRKAIGATKFQISGQFFGESLLFAFLAMFIGYLIIELTLPLFNRLFDNELGMLGITRIQILGYMALLTFIVGLLTGWYPAQVLAKPAPKAIMNKNRDIGASGFFNIRRILVVAQFFITMVLIVTSFTINKQLQWMQNKNLGFDKEHVVDFKMPAKVQNNFETIRQQLLQETWVKDVSGYGPNNLNGIFGKQFEFEGQTYDRMWFASCTAVDYDFLKFFGLELIEGRDFSRDYETDKTDAYIISEKLKKQLGWETAVGKEFRVPELQDRTGRVIGVVKDFNFKSLHSAVEGIVLLINPDFRNYISVRCEPENMQKLFSFMQDIWTQYAPNADFERFILDDVYAQMYFSEMKTRKIMTVFSIFAIFIASIGLFGLVSFSTEQRTREIGVRKVLGASIGNVLLGLSKEYFILLNIAVLIATPAAWYLSIKWMQNFAYKTNIGPGIFILAWFVTLFIAFLTVAGQVYRAATANPVDALRYE